MTQGTKLTLGPVLFNWKPERLKDFYFRIADDPDGMAVETLDEVPFLAVNGTQTMSYHTMDLLAEVGGLAAAGVGRFRLWPHSVDMAQVAALFRTVLDNRVEVAEAETRLADLCPDAEFANGYIHGRPGHLFIEENA